MIGFSVFSTPIGPCGLAWGERGVVAVALPEADEAATRRRLERRHPLSQELAPPPDMRDVVDRISALLGGGDPDLSTVTLDMSGLADFNQRVYRAARAIPRGQTRTYGEVASIIGEDGGARAVGGALGRNPFPIVVPCHRVVAAGGRIGGFSARGGAATKARLLAIEGGRPPTLWDVEP